MGAGSPLTKTIALQGESEVGQGAGPPRQPSSGLAEKFRPFTLACMPRESSPRPEAALFTDEITGPVSLSGLRWPALPALKIPCTWLAVSAVLQYSISSNSPLKNVVPSTPTHGPLPVRMSVLLLMCVVPVSVLPQSSAPSIKSWGVGPSRTTAKWRHCPSLTGIVLEFCRLVPERSRRRRRNSIHRTLLQVWA